MSHIGFQRESPNAVPASGMDKQLNNVPKRSALSCINGPISKHNVLSKNNIWRMDAQNLPQSTAQPAQPLKFEIFDDQMHVSTPNASPKELKLPNYVMKLYKNTDEDDSKENSFWSFPDPPHDVLKQKELEQRWTAPFRKEIYAYLKEQEKKFRPCMSNIRRQADITMEMRTVLVDWMIEVGEEYNFQEETVHLAVSYTDRFLSTMSVVRSKLQLVGTTALFIASKHHEIYAPELKDFVYITDSTYTKKEFLQMEQMLLLAINFNLGPPTANAFLQIYADVASSSELVTLLAQYICEISMLDVNFLMFLPSEIGASSLALANHILEAQAWTPELKQMSGYSLQDIRIIVHCLYEKYATIDVRAQKAVFEKYKSSKFQRVALIQCPSELGL